MTKLTTRLLLAHPNKHHAYQLFLGIKASGLPCILVTPLFNRPWHRLLQWLLPDKIQAKLGGYSAPGIENEDVLSPPNIQILKLISLARGYSFEKTFDSWLSAKINTGKIRAEVLITLQDYLPRSVAAAKSKGWKIWSDQILDNSDSAQERLADAYQGSIENAQLKADNENSSVLEIADIVTFPASYMEVNLRARTKNSCQFFLAPYGVDASIFKPRATNANTPSDTVNIIARTNNLRKGSQLLLKALAQHQVDITKSLNGKVLRVVILGRLDDATKALIESTELCTAITISSKSVPHSEVPGVLAEADLFVMPTLAESLSLAALEALSCGCPIILTEYAGVDTSRIPSCGRLVKPSAESIGEALVSLLATPNLRETYAKNSRELALEIYNWSNYKSLITRAAIAISEE